MESERDEIFLYSEYETRAKPTTINSKFKMKIRSKHGRGASFRRHDIPIRSNDEYIFIDHEIFAVATTDVETN